MILRRPEYRKARLRRRQHRRRWPLGRIFKRIFKKVYSDLRDRMLPLVTPLLAQMQRKDGLGQKHWGGEGNYWDLAVSGAATTRNTPQGEASVNYEATGTALPRPRFWRNPFVA